jgi:integrase
MLDLRSTILAGAVKSGRAERLEENRMARRRYQTGCLFIRGKKRKLWVARWREEMISPENTIRTVQRSEVLGPVSELSKKQAQSLLDSKLRTINAGSHRPQSTMQFKRFVEDIWKPSVFSLLRPGSRRYYGMQIETHVLPAFGSKALCEIDRAHVQCFVAEKRKHGYAGSSVHGMKTALGKILQSAVDWGYVEQNSARGIHIGDRGSTGERVYLSAGDTQKLIASLKEPIRAIVTLLALTGLRIGELLALRWKHVDFLRGVVQVREAVSEGVFGSPKTKSSRRDVPMSEPVRRALLEQHARCRQKGADDLVFATRKQTPLNSKNVRRRVLRPACEALELPAVNWHSFRHTHATLLGEVATLKTAQALLGHSDLETTLNVYTHAIPESQRRAVDKVAEILFPSVPTSQSEQVN